MATQSKRLKGHCLCIKKLEVEEIEEKKKASVDFVM